MNNLDIVGKYFFDINREYKEEVDVRKSSSGYCYGWFVCLFLIFVLKMMSIVPGLQEIKQLFLLVCSTKGVFA